MKLARRSIVRPIRARLGNALGNLDWNGLLRFAIVGVGGTLSYYALLIVLVEFLRVGVMVATSIAFVVVVLQNYALHYVWTFQSAASHATRLPQFVAMSATGFALNWLLMYAGVEIFSINYLLVQAAAVAAVVAWNLAITHLFIFKADIRHKEGRPLKEVEPWEGA